jgi:oligoendopeptidase F
MKTNWDLTHLYRTQEEWNKDYKLLSNKIEDFNSIKFEVNAESIMLILNRISELEMLIERLYCYQKRMIDLDIENIDAKDKANEALELYSKIINIHTKFEKFICSNTNEVLKLLSDRRLEHYNRYIRLIIRRNEHISGDNDSFKNLSKIRNSYRNILEQLKFKNIIDKDLEIELTNANYSTLMKNEDESIRKQAYENYSKGYADLEDQILDCFIKKYREDINLANTENYDSMLNKKMFNLELPDSIINDLINTTNNHLDISKEYIELKKQLLNINKLNIYDSGLSVCKIPDIKITLEEAYDLVVQSLKILGEDYIKEVEEIFNDGWIDIFPKERKNRMSFTSISYLGSYILTNFKEDLVSTRTLAHEIGHRINSKYSSKKNNILNFEFSMFLTEIASKVNEMLFNNYILEKYDDIEVKKYVLNDVICSLHNSIFGQMMLTEFENEVVKIIENNEELDSNIIIDIYLNISTKYNDGIEKNDCLKYGWLKIQHFIMQDSYYLFQYTIGTSLALNISSRILNKEEGFIEKYKKFLSVGNSVSIIDALKIIDINILNSSYMEYAYNTLEQYIKTLKRIYNI